LGAGNTDLLDPNAIGKVDQKEVEEMEASRLSMMPAGLLDTLKEGEGADLVAFLLSGGDRSHQPFRRPGDTATTPSWAG
jgi:hypothetical protein